MYLRKVHIENIRSIAELDLEFAEGDEAGWHVVIGDNGSGKSTLLRALALLLVGPNDVGWLRQLWCDWLRQKETKGIISLAASNSNTSDNLDRGMKFRRLSDQIHSSWYGYNEVEDLGFSASYGPFRRFTGGDQQSEELFQGKPRLTAHLSIFGENIALTESLKWLRDLDYRKARLKPGDDFLDQVKAFVNQEGFLPHHARLTDISPDGVVFTDGEGRQVPVQELSDGYRSVLSMTFELIRQMSAVCNSHQIFSSGDSSKVITPGVVLIDEIDAHLHPTWQRRIGLWFREHFPNIQFIVTTHSPLVCQAAEHGSVWRLPKPGSGEKAEQVIGVELNRLLYGNVLDAYSTELFGEDVGRSDAGKELLQQLALLNVKEVNQGLSKAEKKKQQELRATFPTSTPATNGQRKRGK